MNDEHLSNTEDLDFHYLLTLMPPLHNNDSFAWLPELFSIIGAESFINLCKYCGGETLTIPSLSELSTSIDALQLFYDIYIKKTKTLEDVPSDLSLLVSKIAAVYNKC